MGCVYWTGKGAQRCDVGDFEYFLFLACIAAAGPLRAPLLWFSGGFFRENLEFFDRIGLMPLIGGIDGHTSIE
jgi:hypothetical protein